MSRSSRHSTPFLLALLGLLHVHGARAAAPPWASGFGNLDLGREYEHLVDDQTNYLHRTTPVFTSFFVQRGSLADANNAIPQKSRLWQQLTNARVRVAQVVPLVMDNDGANIARILNSSDPLHGQYLAFWRNLGQALHASGASSPILRIGHEMNLTGSYRWSYGNPALHASDFVKLYRLAADAIRSKAPDAVRCWNPGKRTAKGTIDELWPGNSYVDLVCLDFYDNGTGGYVTDQASWDALVNKTDSHGPIGINAWYKFARARGKRFAVPEWGLIDPSTTTVPTDRPFFIQKMHDYFAQINSQGTLVFESYYNYDYHATGTTQLYPVLVTHQKSSKLYQQLFGVP